jgi:hypothetical protein
MARCNAKTGFLCRLGGVSVQDPEQLEDHHELTN